MTHNRFDHIADNIESYKGKEIVWEKYIPSADRWTTHKGRIAGIYNVESFLISWCGIEHVAYYTKVELPSDKKLTLKRDGSIVYEGKTIGTWKCNNLWQEQGRRDKSGNLTVHYTWEAELTNGKKVFNYTGAEMRASILNIINK